MADVPDNPLRTLVEAYGNRVAVTTELERAIAGWSNAAILELAKAIRMGRLVAIGDELHVYGGSVPVAAAPPPSAKARRARRAKK